MATFDDVRRIALTLADAVPNDEGTAFRVNGKLFAWVWMERLAPKRARVPNPQVLVVRVAPEMDKDELISINPNVFFTEPHYRGYAAILIRLAAIDEAMLETLIADSWRLKAPKRLRDRI